MARWLKMWARGVFAVLLCRDMTKALIPKRPSRRAVMAPEGPAPTMSTWKSIMGKGVYARGRWVDRCGRKRCIVRV